MGYSRCKSDAGIYIYIHPKMKEHTYAVVYVDDILFLGKPKSKLTQELKQKFMATWECRDQGEVKEFLGMTIK